MIKQLDRIALATALPEYKLEAGDIGTVVMVHEGGRGFTVEFMTLDGSTVAVATVMADAVRPIRAREIAHARQVA